MSEDDEDFESFVRDKLTSIDRRLERLEAVLSGQGEVDIFVEEKATMLLQRSPYPSPTQLLSVATEISQRHGGPEVDQVVSKLKSWFRKQREYMTHRINTVCMNKLKQGEVEACLFLR